MNTAKARCLLRHCLKGVLEAERLFLFVLSSWGPVLSVKKKWIAIHFFFSLNNTSCYILYILRALNK